GLGLLDLGGALPFGGLAGFTEDGLRLALRLAAGGLVVGLHLAGLGERGLRAVDGLLDGLLTLVERAHHRPPRELPQEQEEQRKDDERPEDEPDVGREKRRFGEEQRHGESGKGG